MAVENRALWTTPRRAPILARGIDMALWLIRAGRHGEHERRFLDESRVYVTWTGLDEDLSKLKDVLDLRATLQNHYPQSGNKKIINNASQIWPFVTEMAHG